MKQLIINKTNFVENGCYFSNSIFRLYAGLKFSLERNSVQKYFLLSACFCLDSKYSLREMDQKSILVEQLLMGTRTWKYFASSKFFDYM